MLLVRHGSVDPPSRPDDLTDGRSDPPLNDRGRGQAEAVCRLLAERADVPVFASPLRRATQTVAALAQAATVLSALTEVYLGEWEGHGIATRGAAGDPEFVAMMRGQRWDVIPGAEPAGAFAGRVRDALGTVVDGGPPVVVVATHAGVIGEMCRQVTGSEPFAFLGCVNGSVTRIARLPEGRWTLLSFNETSHLGNERTHP